MDARITVHVGSVTIADAKRQQGVMFLPNIRALLAGGYKIEIHAFDKKIAFEDANKFTSWFLVDRLKALHAEMERHDDKGEDWAQARHLEDAIGSEQASENQIEQAQSLLARFGR